MSHRRRWRFETEETFSDCVDFPCATTTSAAKWPTVLAAWPVADPETGTTSVTVAMAPLESGSGPAVLVSINLVSWMAPIRERGKSCGATLPLAAALSGLLHDDVDAAVQDLPSTMIATVETPQAVAATRVVASGRLPRLAVINSTAGLLVAGEDDAAPLESMGEGAPPKSDGTSPMALTVVADLGVPTAAALWCAGGSTHDTTTSLNVMIGTSTGAVVVAAASGETCRFYVAIPPTRPHCRLFCSVQAAERCVHALLANVNILHGLTGGLDWRAAASRDGAVRKLVPSSGVPGLRGDALASAILSVTGKASGAAPSSESSVYDSAIVESHGGCPVPVADHDASDVVLFTAAFLSEAARFLVASSSRDDATTRQAELADNTITSLPVRALKLVNELSLGDGGVADAAFLRVPSVAGGSIGMPHNNGHQFHAAAASVANARSSSGFTLAEGGGLPVAVSASGAASMATIRRSLLRQQQVAKRCSDAAAAARQTPVLGLCAATVSTSLFMPPEEGDDLSSPHEEVGGSSPPPEATASRGGLVPPGSRRERFGHAAVRLLGRSPAAEPAAHRAVAGHASGSGGDGLTLVVATRRRTDATSGGLEFFSLVKSMSLPKRSDVVKEVAGAVAGAAVDLVKRWWGAWAPTAIGGKAPSSSPGADGFTQPGPHAVAVVPNFHLGSRFSCAFRSRSLCGLSIDAVCFFTGAGPGAAAPRTMTYPDAAFDELVVASLSEPMPDRSLRARGGTTVHCRPPHCSVQLTPRQSYLAAYDAAAQQVFLIDLHANAVLFSVKGVRGGQIAFTRGIERELWMQARDDQRSPSAPQRFLKHCHADTPVLWVLRRFGGGKDLLEAYAPDGVYQVSRHGNDNNRRQGAAQLQYRVCGRIVPSGCRIVSPVNVDASRACDTTLRHLFGAEDPAPRQRQRRVGGAVPAIVAPRLPFSAVVLSPPVHSGASGFADVYFIVPKIVQVVTVVRAETDADGPKIASFSNWGSACRRFVDDHEDDGSRADSGSSSSSELSDSATDEDPASDVAAQEERITCPTTARVVSLGVPIGGIDSFIETGGCGTARRATTAIRPLRLARLVFHDYVIAEIAHQLALGRHGADTVPTWLRWLRDELLRRWLEVASPGLDDAQLASEAAAVTKAAFRWRRGGRVAVWLHRHAAEVPASVTAAQLTAAALFETIEVETLTALRKVATLRAVFARLAAGRRSIDTAREKPSSSCLAVAAQAASMEATAVDRVIKQLCSVPVVGRSPAVEVEDDDDDIDGQPDHPFSSLPWRFLCWYRSALIDNTAAEEKESCDATRDLALSSAEGTGEIMYVPLSSQQKWLRCSDDSRDDDEGRIAAPETEDMLTMLSRLLAGSELFDAVAGPHRTKPQFVAPWSAPTAVAEENIRVAAPIRRKRMLLLRMGYLLFHHSLTSTEQTTHAPPARLNTRINSVADDVSLLAAIGMASPDVRQLYVWWASSTFPTLRAWLAFEAEGVCRVSVGDVSAAVNPERRPAMILERTLHLVAHARVWSREAGSCLRCLAHGSSLAHDVAILNVAAASCLPPDGTALNADCQRFRDDVVAHLDRFAIARAIFPTSLTSEANHDEALSLTQVPLLAAGDWHPAGWIEQRLLAANTEVPFTMKGRGERLIDSLACFRHAATVLDDPSRRRAVGLFTGSKGLDDAPDGDVVTALGRMIVAAKKATAHPPPSAPTVAVSFELFCHFTIPAVCRVALSVVERPTASQLTITSALLTVIDQCLGWPQPPNTGMASIEPEGCPIRVRLTRHANFGNVLVAVIAALRSECCRRLDDADDAQYLICCLTLITRAVSLLVRSAVFHEKLRKATVQLPPEGASTHHASTSCPFCGISEACTSRDVTRLCEVLAACDVVLSAPTAFSRACAGVARMFISQSASIESDGLSPLLLLLHWFVVEASQHVAFHRRSTQRPRHALLGVTAGGGGDAPRARARNVFVDTAPLAIEPTRSTSDQIRHGLLLGRVITHRMTAAVAEATAMQRLNHADDTTRQAECYQLTAALLGECATRIEELLSVTPSSYPATGEVDAAMHLRWRLASCSTPLVVALFASVMSTRSGECNDNRWALCRAWDSSAPTLRLAFAARLQQILAPGGESSSSSAADGRVAVLQCWSAAADAAEQWTARLLEGVGQDDPQDLARCLGELANAVAPSDTIDRWCQPFDDFVMPARDQTPRTRVPAELWSELLAKMLLQHVRLCRKAEALGTSTSFAARLQDGIARHRDRDLLRWLSGMTTSTVLPDTISEELLRFSAQSCHVVAATIDTLRGALPLTAAEKWTRCEQLVALSALVLVVPR